ncbi:MAG: cyanophycin synthetase, partial [Burkholderiales bacterium 21-58-4]
LADDVTDEVHPEVAAAVILAARVVGLDVAGVDIVAEDISRPLEEQRGAIVEVNAGPGLLMHLKPAKGRPRPVGQDIVDSLFPKDDDGRIPIVGIAGTRGTSLIARLVTWLIHLSGKSVGLACRDGLFLDCRRADKNDCANWAAGQRLLINKSLEAAVFENGAEVILSQGVAYDRCLVGVVTDVEGADTLGHYDIHDAEQVYQVLRTQVDIVLPEGAAVLNADDELVSEMAKYCDGEVIFYASEPGPVAKHVETGGRAVFLRGRYVFIAQGKREERLMEGHAGMLPTIAAALALGLDAGLVRNGMEYFEFEAKRSMECI